MDYLINQFTLNIWYDSSCHSVNKINLSLSTPINIKFFYSSNPFNTLN